jgi:hypothetical protein
MRPLPVDRAFAQLAFAIDHRASEVVAARAHRSADGGWARSRELAGGVRGVYQRKNKTGTYLLCTATKVLLQRTMRSAMTRPLRIRKGIAGELIGECASRPLGPDRSKNHVD